MKHGTEHKYIYFLCRKFNCTHDAISRFKEKRKAIENEINELLEERNLREPLQLMLDDLEGESS